DQDCVRVGQDESIVIDDRHLAERVERKESWATLFAAGKIYVDQFMLELEQIEEQFDPVRMARQDMAIEADRSGRPGCGHRLSPWRSLSASLRRSPPGINTRKLI